MKSRIIMLFVVIGIFVSQSAKAQFFVEYNLGYGTFNMADLKSLLSKDNTVEGLKTTNNFPGYFTHGIHAGFMKGRSSFGINLGYQNTGGQRAFEDYSGEYKYQIRAKGYKTALFYRYRLSKADKLSLFAEVAPGAIFNNVNMKSSLYLTASEQSKKDEANLKGINLFVEPALVARYQINNMYLQLHAGYQWSPIKPKLNYNGNKTTVNADWDGLRISLDFVVTLQK